jgi:type III secretory pathway lipoprotein EscJ
MRAILTQIVSMCTCSRSVRRLRRGINEIGQANEVVVFLTEEDYHRIIAERKQNASKTAQ